MQAHGYAPESHSSTRLPRLHGDKCCHCRNSKARPTEIRGIHLKKKKVTRGWPNCLKKLPPKAASYDNDIYAIHTDESEHHYEEPKEKESQDEWKPREKNMRVFYKLNVKDNIDVTTTPHEEEYTDENYESVEEWETAM